MISRKEDTNEKNNDVASASDAYFVACGIGSQSLGGGGQAFSANLQMMDALQREYSNARYDFKLPDLCLSGGYALYTVWDWNAGDGLKKCL